MPPLGDEDLLILKGVPSGSDGGDGSGSNQLDGAYFENEEVQGPGGDKGMNGYMEDFQYNITYNPNISQVVVENPAQDVFLCILYSIDGKQISEKLIGDSRVELNNVSKGAYMVYIRSATKEYYKKIMAY